MYVDYRLSLWLNIKTKELNKSYLDILKEVSNNNLGNIEYENSTELLEQMGAHMITTRRDDLPSINHTYQGNYYLCIQKVFSETSNFAVTCTEESLKSFEKYVTTLV